MSKLPRVNCHVHVFNLEVATTEWAKDVIEERIRHDYGETAAKVLGGFARDLVDGLGDLNEERLLQELLDRLDLTDRISDNLQTIGLRALRRLVDRQLEKLRKDPEMDFRETDAHDLLETLRIGGKADVDGVMDWLMSQVADDAAVVPLMMDLTDGVSDVTDVAAGESQFERQLEATSRQVKRYPGRVLPFVFVHPKRPNHLQLMRQAVDELGYVGVKLYPSLGYELTDPAMDEVYTFCQAHGVPIMIHTNKGGFVGAVEANRFPDPDVWRAQILPRFPNLKVCMAHFGGSGSLTEGDDPLNLPPEPDDPDQIRWGQKIINLIRDPQFPNIYADVAFHRSGMDSDDRQARYFNRLQGMLGHADMQSRILFGTDFWLIRPRLRESSHWRYFESNLTDAEFERLAVTNPAEFLGLPGGGGTNGTIQSYVRFLGVELQKEAVANELASPPAPWLLDAIEADATLGAAVRQQIETLADQRSVPARLFGDVGSWRDLLDELQAIRLDADLPAVLTEPLDVSLDRVTTSVLDAAVSFEAGASLQIETFRDVDQRDQDAILRPPPGEIPMDAPERDRLRRPAGTLVPFVADHAWLKARFEARIAGEIGASTGLASLQIDGSKSVVLTDYRAHPRATPLIEAVRQTVRRPRFALDRDDVLRLGDGDAVSYATRGRIGGELTLSWADVFTSGLDRLTETLGSPIPLRLSVDLGAAVSARLEIDDDFRVAFARRGERIRVAVSKIKATSKSATVRLDTGVEFADQDQLKDVLGQLIGQRLGQARDRIERFLGLDAVADDADRELLGELEAELNEQGLAAVQGAIAGLQTRLQTTLEAIVTTRLQVGFTYHYERLETNAVLFEADLSERIVEQLHHELVDGDLSGVLDRFYGGAVDDIDLHQYLRFREVERRRSWGFHLGSLGDQNERTTRFSTSVNVDDDEKMAFLGLRSYESKTGWPDVSRGRLATRVWRWAVDFRAEMADYVETPHASDFRYGLGFRMSWDGRFFKGDLDEWLDQARLWRAVGPAADRDTIFAAFEPMQRQDVTVELEMLFDHELLASLLHGPLAKSPDDDTRRSLEAGALAAALPFRDENARRTPAARREHFTSIWKDFLTEETEVSFNQMGRRSRARHWARRLATQLDRAGLGKAASRERNFLPNAGSSTVLPWTFGGRLFLDGAPIDELATARRGLEHLREVLPNPNDGHSIAAPDAPATRVADIFDDLEACWKQTHYLRAAGALLADAAHAIGQLDQVHSSFTIRAEHTDAQRVDIGGVPGRDEG